MDQFVYTSHKKAARYRLIYITVLSLILIATGCTKYQYVWLQSDLPQQNQQEFVNENDTLRIVYRYNGIDCPVKIDIYNKLSTPVYVDLSQSAIIIDNDILPLWNGNNRITGQIQGSGIEWTETYSEFSGDFQGGSQWYDAIRFIPPQARISVSGLHLTNQFLNEWTSVKPSKVKLATTTGSTTGKGFSYNKEDSPMRFRSYITYTIKNDYVHPRYVDDEFWVSETVESMVSPMGLTSGPANRYYVKKPTEFGEFTTALTGVVLLVGIMAVSASETMEEEY
ncbi:MAG: hypothetical protein GVY19_07325 [Bacteroidetes bacterium]|nr:hypothetical protein [Bacteroidota bacterium]